MRKFILFTIDNSRDIHNGAVHFAVGYSLEEAKESLKEQLLRFIQISEEATNREMVTWYGDYTLLQILELIRIDTLILGEIRDTQSQQLAQAERGEFQTILDLDEDTL